MRYLVNSDPMLLLVGAVKFKTQHLHYYITWKITIKIVNVLIVICIHFICFIKLYVMYDFGYFCTTKHSVRPLLLLNYFIMAVAPKVWLLNFICMFGGVLVGALHVCLVAFYSLGMFLRGGVTVSRYSPKFFLKIWRYFKFPVHNFLNFCMMEIFIYENICIYI